VVRIRLDGRGDALAGVALPAGIEPLGAGELQALLAHDPLAASAEGGPDAPGEGARGDSWIALLTAASAGAVLGLRVRGAVVSPLELVSDTAATSGVLPLRVLLVLEAGAQLELLQVHRAAAASLTTVLVEARLGAGSVLRHGLVGQGAAASVLLAAVAVRQELGSHYAFSSAVAGWGLSRLEPRVFQASGAATTRLRALQCIDGQQLADQHSEVRFGGPDGSLDQLHKVIAAGAGRSVFDGAVRVPRLAQRTQAVQMSRSLLLSDRARIDTKPQLEIVADDVKCAHGATVTRLQQEELFYLRSRGINAASAGRLLLRGFCAEVLADLPAAAAIWQPLAMAWGDEATER
jgi:Fe-S cluster assembly protein SufD